MNNQTKLNEGHVANELFFWENMLQNRSLTTPIQLWPKYSVKFCKVRPQISASDSHDI